MAAGNIPVSGFPLSGLNASGGWIIDSATDSGRGATVSRPGLQGGRVADASLPDARGDRIIGGGIIRGHEGRWARGPEELVPGFRRLKAERLIPERLTTVAVTRHLE